MLLSCEFFSSMSVQATENVGMRTSNNFFILDMDSSVKYWLSNQSNPLVFPNTEGGVSLVSKK